MINACAITGETTTNPRLNEIPRVFDASLLFSALTGLKRDKTTEG